MNEAKRFEKVLKDDELIFLAKNIKLFLMKIPKTYFDKDKIICQNKAKLDLFLRQNAKKIFTFYLKNGVKNRFILHAFKH